MPNRTTGAEANVHLISIRKALANGNAAVMVGAGFSRNAEGGENLATWSQLSEALSAELAPDRPLGSFSPASASQLAEQYSRVYSPTHLEHLIKKCVPDDEVTPGQLHKSLLELPWSDVFTTNYDTLLERAADQLFSVSYFAVCSRQDIPLSKVLGRRRIVKLHGSFPSHRPFILTEEEYRTYPERFAPFVNMVRQSLLENVMCLIGFSGDDPNFLHWLGWVRDMLDKHALPVYLFLAREPTLGERKLLEARGVVPVLLPIPEKVSPDDYPARYEALFEELERPLSNSPLDWGQCPHLSWSIDDQSDESLLNKLWSGLAVVNEHRLTYPGWLVAPRKVRARFRHVGDWLETALSDKRLRTQLSTKSPEVVLAAAEMHYWVQQLLLRPVDDELASLGKKALDDVVQRPFKDLDEDAAQFLRSVGIGDASAFLIRQKAAAVALLVWARQSHRTNEYEALLSWLREPVHHDHTIEDRLQYEAAMWRLQHADRLGARRVILDWRPSGADAYVHVLRGSLLAEVSDAGAAMPILLQAIQTLRRQHRSRPGDPALTSKEAWACVIASLIQDAKKFTSALGLPRQGASTKEASNDAGEDFDKRLKALVARGYSAREELNAVLADLNAETQVPVSGPRRLLGFNVGTVSPAPMIDHRSELGTKISSSFAWLELAERVGLPPHTKQASFYAQQMLQSAWWARFADTPERSVGLLLRSARSEALKPFDPTRPPHQSGWLTRRDVAAFRLDAATDLTAALLQQVALHINEGREASASSSKLIFMLEAAGRLVIRVHDEAKLIHFFQQVLGWHLAAAFQAEPALWSPASLFLRRVVEALPTISQHTLFRQVFTMPLAPAPVSGRQVQEHELRRWLDVADISSDCSPAVAAAEQAGWQPIANNLLHRLRILEAHQPIWTVWRRLSVLRRLKLLDAKTEREVGAILWQGVEPGQLPEIPGIRPIGAIHWPAPQPNVAKLVLRRVLQQPLRPFSTGYMLLATARRQRSYHVGDVSETMEPLRILLSRTTPSLSDRSRLVEVIGEWMDHDLEDLVQDHEQAELRDSTASIIEHIDAMLAGCIEAVTKRARSHAIEKLISEVIALDARLDALPFPRHGLSVALIKSGDRPHRQQHDVAHSIVCALRSKEGSVSLRAFGAALRLLEDEHTSVRSAGRTVFLAIVACAFGQQGAAFSRAIHVLSDLSKAAWDRYLDDSSLCILNGLLEALQGSLDYSQPFQSSPIESDAVPHLRLGAFQLAAALIDTAKVNSVSARRWLEKAGEDPLPEIRFERFRGREL